MMSNYNTAWFTDSVSYPMVGFLTPEGEIAYDVYTTELLKGIKWKDINKKFKNDYDKTVEYELGFLKERGIDIEPIKTEIEKIYNSIIHMKLSKLGAKQFPPKGY